MSVNAVDWALRFAPVDARHNGAARVLMCLANVADDEGRNAHPTHRKLAAWCKCSVSTVKRHLSWLEANGLIRRGDQRQAGHFSEWHRPVVWDLCLGNRLELDPDFFDSNDIDSTRGGRPSTENRAKGNPGSHVDRGYGDGDTGKPQLTGEPRFTGEWSSDANRLAVLGVTMQFAPESTCMMIASDILAENAPLSLPALRERINTPDGMVNTDLLFSRLIDNGTTPDPARIDMAMGILGPLEANAPTDACYRIIGLKAMLNLAMGDGEKARELAEQAIGYDASDRFASSVLDRLPETDPAMEAANVWENGGHLGR